MKQDKFFEQSSLDALNDYVYSCKEGRGENWDWVILTAANEHQASAYKLQIDERKVENCLPIGTKFAVVTDYKEERVGSGGATLNVIRYICEQEGAEYIKKKILVIHSGGDSKRIPQYSACGKLFAPVPRILPNGNISTLFDELIILASGIPSRVGNGMMIFPSDTQMLFNPLQLDLFSCDAAGLSIKAPVAEGIEHGVFLQNNSSSDHRNRNVAKFLHKMPEPVLRNIGAVDDKDQIDIDTGCIWLGSNVVRSLRDLCYDTNGFNKVWFEKFVNPEVCLNFYADFVYPLAEESTLEEYLEEAPENGMSEELKQCRKLIWDKLSRFNMSLVKMIPARYIHFGMTHELYDLFINEIDSYRYLGWCSRVNTNSNYGTVINSLISDQVEFKGNSIIEDSIVAGNTIIGDKVILSNVETENVLVPKDVVLSGIALRDGKYVCRIYGVEDNPKASGDARFLNNSINTLAKITRIGKRDIWGDKPASIWNASIYSVSDSMIQAVENSLLLYKIINGEGTDMEIENWKSSLKMSLGDSFRYADVPKMLKWKSEIRRSVRLQIFQKGIAEGNQMETEIENLCCNVTIGDIRTIINSVIKLADSERFPINMRLYLAASDICKKYQEVTGIDAGKYEDAAYDSIKSCILHETFSRFNYDYRKVRIKNIDIEVRLPVRVNFCGSPSDAAPYCLEHGGTMVDGALLLRGEKPIRVMLQKIESGFEFGSEDQNRYVHLDDIRDVRKCGNPFDPFALHKAVLISTGIVPFNGDVTTQKFCESIGGGIRLVTSANVPKGSGLGTSSIIAAAAVRAIHMFFGIDSSDEMVYAQVFLAEQLMNTGGGWQDQVGGLTPGIKYFKSQAGVYQKIDVEKLDVSTETMKELNDRFVLIFSGQRRLARNVLREEMNQCIRNEKEALNAVKQIQEYCAIMRHYLLKGDITEFAHYITKQFELVKTLDKAASNTCIEYIFDVIDDLIDGKSICGAGGGGFLQVILKTGVTKKQLKERIFKEFVDCGVEVWDCKLI